MAKPPPDVDPEKFIFGKGLYSNTITHRAYADEAVFRIDPAPLPVVSIIVHNVIFVAFFYGFYWLVNRQENPQEPEAWRTYAPLGIGLMTCVLYTVFTWWEFNRDLSRGPWLVYDKASSRVRLPREGETFKRDEIVHLQYVTTKRLDSGGDQLSELNIITERDGVRKRFHLLRSIANVRAFDSLLKPVIEHTQLPVMRVTDGLWGWTITETPYG